MDDVISDVDATLAEFVDSKNIHLVLPFKPHYNGVNKEAIGRINYRSDESFVNVNKDTLYVKDIKDVDGGKVDDLGEYKFSGSLKVRLFWDVDPDVLYMEILENPSNGELKEGLLLQVEIL
ncbi:hypothetical protein GQ472_04930 [archaeon]|nr:hypothetical protein [archaeon]